MPRQTTFAKPGEINRQWHLIDADDQVLGRLATQIATLLMGKHRPSWTPHVDCGDFVVVSNAETVALTGRRRLQKTYTRYSGYPGGLRTIPISRVLETHPERVIEQAVKRMLPKTRLGRQMYKKLKVYAGTEHPHGDAKPLEMTSAK